MKEPDTRSVWEAVMMSFIIALLGFSVAFVAGVYTGHQSAYEKGRENGIWETEVRLGVATPAGAPDPIPQDEE